MKYPSVVVVAALAGGAAADPVRARPIGAIGGGADLNVTGTRGGPKQRVAAEGLVWVTRSYGIYVAARRIVVDPAGDEGQVTAGIALRAASARPRLELVLHGDAGYAWPSAPVIGGGLTTYIWPLTKLPVAVTTGFGAYLVLEGSERTRVGLGLGLGIAVAR